MLKVSSCTDLSCAKRPVERDEGLKRPRIILACGSDVDSNLATGRRAGGTGRHLDPISSVEVPPLPCTEDSASGAQAAVGPISPCRHQHPPVKETPPCFCGRPRLTSELAV